MKFDDLPLSLMAEIARCKSKAEDELRRQLYALQGKNLEAFGLMIFEPGHPLWKEAETLAVLKFGRAGDGVSLEWRPDKYEGAWKIAIPGAEGYVTTESVCMCFGWKLEGPK